MPEIDVPQLEFPFAERLVGLADQLRTEYLTARPWPHIVIPNLFPDEVLDAAVAELRDLDRTSMERSINRRHVKQELRDLEQLGPVTRHVLGLMDSEPFIRFVSDLTGVPDLVNDADHVG